MFILTASVPLVMLFRVSVLVGKERRALWLQRKVNVSLGCTLILVGKKASNLIQTLMSEEGKRVRVMRNVVRAMLFQCWVWQQNVVVTSWWSPKEGMKSPCNPSTV